MKFQRHIAGLIVAGVATLAWAFPADAIEIKSVRSPGGIEAWLVEDHKIPVVSVEWTFKEAGSRDPAGKQGLSELVARTMDEGAGPLDARTFQAKLRDKAITLAFDTDADAYSGSLRTLSENREEAFEMARLSLTEPRFEQEALERMRAATIARLKSEATDPDAIAERVFFQTAFPESVYGRPTRGTPESLSAVTREDLLNFARTKLGRDNLDVGVAGDITPEELGRALDKIFGALPAKAEIETEPLAAPAGAGRTILVPRPAAQAVIMTGQAGVRRDDPDWYAALVMNHILGGGTFSSRLMTEVREKRGLTYGVYSQLVPFERTALIMAQGSSAKAKAATALDLIRAEWARMAKDGVSEEELADAKTYLTGSFPLQFSSTAAIARTVLVVKRDKLGLDYLSRRDALINGVSVDDARRAARRLLNPETLLTVVVGEAEGLRSTCVQPVEP